MACFPASAAAESVLSLAISFGPATLAHLRKLTERRRRDPRAIARAIRPRTAQTRQRAVGQRNRRTLSLYIDTTIQEQYRKHFNVCNKAGITPPNKPEPNSSPSLPTTSASAQP